MGTNVKATDEEFFEIKKLGEANKVEPDNTTQYWLYSPGRNADSWNEFQNEGIMAIEWDEIGSLTQYKDKAEIIKALKKSYSEKNPTNNGLANFDFYKSINIGDIIISKTGREQYLGYGVVTSDYYWDENREKFKSCRKVDWIKAGIWKEKDRKISFKTLTNITNQTDYVSKLIKLIGIGKMKKIDISVNTILYGPFRYLYKRQNTSFCSKPFS